MEKPGAIAIFIPPATLAARPGRPQVRPRPKSIAMIYRSKAPLRIGLAGGGTDVSPYSDLYGGAILNATVSLYAHATIEPTDEPQIVLRALDRNQTLRYELQSELPIDGVLDLHKGIYNHVVSQFGPIESGFSLNTFVDAPAGSGLGSSSTLVVAILGAFAQWLRLPLGSYDVAQRAYRIERDELGMAGGKQDQYAATFGGFNYMEFYDDRVIVNPLRIKREYINELENNLLLYYTSKSRVSAEIIEQQQQNVQSQIDKQVEDLRRQEEANKKNDPSYDAGKDNGATGSMMWPCPSCHTITSEFGWRYHPIYHTQKYHSGVDIGASYGASIVAADGGTVITAGAVSGYGNCVVINHGNGITTLYGHMSSIAVSSGQKVSKGQTIGYVGSTGNSTGPHLHWEVTVNGVRQNPLNYAR